MNNNFRTPAIYDRNYGIDLLDSHGKIAENVRTYAAARFAWHEADKAYREAVTEDRLLREECAMIEKKNNQIRADWFATHPKPTPKDLQALAKLLAPLPKRKKVKLPRKPLMRYYKPGTAPTPV